MIKFTRRQFLRMTLGGLAAAMLAPSLRAEIIPARTLRIALLHLAPIPGEVEQNRQLVERAVTTAAESGSAWILTPELCITGYTFADRIGTDWILPQPDPWMTGFSQLTSRLGVTVFLSHPERDPHSEKLHNTVFVIAPDGTIVGKHRKIHTLRVGSEAWSSPGERATALSVPPFKQVGILICADASSKEMAKSLKDQGAELLVSSAAWAPGLHGPSGEWERCTSETGLPLIVCNRTGPDRTLDFTKGESVVVQSGQRILSFSSPRSTIVLLDWDLINNTLATSDYQTIPL